VRLRELELSELARVAEIDRRERIDAIYVQHGSQLELREGDYSSPPWRAEGTGEHSLVAVRVQLEEWAAAGGTAIGVFDGDRLVGIGLVVPHLRPQIAQLAFLYVNADHRGLGIGARLSTRLEEIARAASDTAMVVSATPSENTVRFYLNRGFAPMAEPLSELYELEPEDIHLDKTL
jgi:GNAT superfamily N-acetyltransferase